MENTIILTIMAILLSLATPAILIWLQIKLSQRQNKWLGLIFPFISFAFSIITVLSMAAFYTMKTTVTITDSNGTVISQEESPVKNENQENASMVKNVAVAIPVFLIYNIPTAIYLTIYFYCKDKLKKQGLLTKMQIQDL